MESQWARVVLPKREQDDGCRDDDPTDFCRGETPCAVRGTFLATPYPQLGTNYDVSADGQRFLMVKQGEQLTGPLPFSRTVATTYGAIVSQDDLNPHRSFVRTLCSGGMNLRLRALSHSASLPL